MNYEYEYTNMSAHHQLEFYVRMTWSSEIDVLYSQDRFAFARDAGNSTEMSQNANASACSATSA